jgi:hypothetical protein
MKRLITALMLVLAMAGGAQALETKDIVAIAAMPLAVAAVSDLTGVPANDLVNVVTSMNRAQVPAPQFVEIVRYTPVALVDDPMDPRFVHFAANQYARGLSGDAYANSLADRLQLYDVGDVRVLQPVTVTPSYVVERDYVPAYVVQRVEQRFDPVALVAMPLAVAAVSNLAGISTSDLFGLVSALNRAAVPAPQFVEVVRYAPVAFYEPDNRFVSYVVQDVDRGIVGIPLARAIADRYRSYGVREIDVVAPRPRLIVERQAFVPPIVEQRYARVHPLGGPPGQLKKVRGLQTGAEVVHGERPGRVASSRKRAVRVESVKERPVRRVTRSSDAGGRKEPHVKRQKPPHRAPSVERGGDHGKQLRSGKKGGGHSVGAARGKKRSSVSPGASQPRGKGARGGNHGGGHGKGKKKG